MRIPWTASAIALAGLVLLAPGLANRAAAQTMSFDIPAGDAATSLAAWSKASGIRLDAPPVLTSAGTTKAVKGEMDARVALDRLLADTPLGIIVDDGFVITIGPNFKPHLDSEFTDWYAQSPYNQEMRRIFEAVYAPTVIARLTVSPTFSKDWALGLKLDRGAYSIVHIARAPKELDEDLSNLRAGLPANPPDIIPQVCEVPLDAALGRRIATAGQAVMRIRNFTELTTDGTYYDFTFRDGPTELRRNIGSPDEQVADGRLVAVAQAMADYCEHPNLKTAALSAKLKALEKALPRTSR